jgi:hypothetical protein
MSSCPACWTSDSHNRWTTIRGPVHGYGVTWWEVVVIYLASKGTDAVVGEVFDALLKSIKARVTAWYKARRDAGGPKGSRPMALDVRDEEGNILLGLELDPDGEVKDVTAERRAGPLKPRPEPADADDDQASVDDEARTDGNDPRSDG